MKRLVYAIIIQFTILGIYCDAHALAITPGRWHFTYQTIEVENRKCWVESEYEPYEFDVDITISGDKADLIALQKTFLQQMKEINSAHQYCRTEFLWCDVEEFVNSAAEKIGEELLLEGVVQWAKVMNMPAVAAKVAIAKTLLTSAGIVAMGTCDLCYLSTSWTNPVFLSALAGYWGCEYGIKGIELLMEQAQFDMETSTLKVPNFYLGGQLYWIELNLNQDNTLNLTNFGPINSPSE